MEYQHLIFISLVILILYFGLSITSLATFKYREHAVLLTLIFIVVYASSNTTLFLSEGFKMGANADDADAIPVMSDGKKKVYDFFKKNFDNKQMADDGQEFINKINKMTPEEVNAEYGENSRSVLSMAILPLLVYVAVFKKPETDADKRDSYYNKPEQFYNDLSNLIKKVKEDEENKCKLYSQMVQYGSIKNTPASVSKAMAILAKFVKKNVGC